MVVQGVFNFEIFILIMKSFHSRDLLSAALYTVIGGELIYLCGEEASPVWRVAPQCLSSLAYYW